MVELQGDLSFYSGHCRAPNTYPRSGNDISSGKALTTVWLQLSEYLQSYSSRIRMTRAMQIKYGFGKRRSGIVFPLHPSLFIIGRRQIHRKMNYWLRPAIIHVDSQHVGESAVITGPSNSKFVCLHPSRIFVEFALKPRSMCCGTSVILLLLLHPPRDSFHQQWFAW